MFVSIIGATGRAVKGGGRQAVFKENEFFSKSKSPQVTIDWPNPTTPNLTSSTTIASRQVTPTPYGVDMLANASGTRPKGTNLLARLFARWRAHRLGLGRQDGADMGHELVRLEGAPDR